MGRHKLEIDPVQVEELAAIHCSIPEMAAVLKCDRATLHRRFAEEIKEGRKRGRTSLKRWQWKAAENGNTTMMIWLGKQILGQSDKLETDNTNRTPSEADESTLITRGTEVAGRIGKAI